eukprot:2532137-Amphidinium_carterae.1
MELFQWVWIAYSSRAQLGGSRITKKASKEASNQAIASNITEAKWGVASQAWSIPLKVITHLQIAQSGSAHEVFGGSIQYTSSTKSGFLIRQALHSVLWCINIAAPRTI